MKLSLDLSDYEVDGLRDFFSFLNSLSVLDRDRLVKSVQSVQLCEISEATRDRGIAAIAAVAMQLSRAVEVELKES